MGKIRPNSKNKGKNTIRVLILASILSLFSGVSLGNQAGETEELLPEEIETALVIKLHDLSIVNLLDRYDKGGVFRKGFWVTSTSENSCSLKFRNPEIERRLNVHIYSTDKNDFESDQGPCREAAFDAIEQKKTFVVTIKGLSPGELQKIKSGRIVFYKDSDGQIKQRRVMDLNLNVAKEIGVTCHTE